MRGEKAPARPGVPPPLPSAAHSPPLRTCSRRTHPGTGNPGCYAGEPGPKSLLNPEQTWPGGHRGAAAPLSGTPAGGPELSSRRFFPVSFLSAHCGAARTRGAPSRTGPPPLRGPGWTRGRRRPARRGAALCPGSDPHREPGGRRTPPLRVVFPVIAGKGAARPRPARGIRAAGCGLLVCSALGDLWHTREGDRDRLGSWEPPPPGTESGRSLVSFLPSFPTCPRESSFREKLQTVVELPM